jgi:hypothetical protein
MQDAYAINGLETLPQVGSLLAKLGRYEDAYIAHVAEGETVVPLEVLDSNPALKEMLFAQMRDMGIEPERYIVGNELNSINPVTGQPEFFLKKLWQGVKKVLKVAAPVIGAIAGSFIPIPIVGPMIGSFVASKIAGYDTKSALLGAAASGIGAYGLGGSAAAQAGGYLGFSGGLGGPSLGSALLSGVKSQGLGSLIQAAAPAVQAPVDTAATSLGGSFKLPFSSGLAAQTTGAATGANAVAAATPAATTNFATGTIAEPLVNMAIKNPGLVLAGGSMLASLLDKPEKIKPSLVNTTTGYDVYSENPDQYNIGNLGPAPVSYSNSPGQYVSNAYYSPQIPAPQMQPIDYTRSFAQFPVQPMYMAKRGGHISGPGTGTSDSIPAMLSDGEFVMTAKAVKGAGGGDRRKGAKKMYAMMRQFEALNG